MASGGAALEKNTADADDLKCRPLHLLAQTKYIAIHRCFSRNIGLSKCWPPAILFRRFVFLGQRTAVVTPAVAVAAPDVATTEVWLLNLLLWE
jgi:hypothetical protein